MKPHSIKCSLESHHSNDAIGSSLLKILIEQSPAHYLYAREHKSEPTPAQLFGSAIHEAILEPNLFKEKMVIEPKFEGTGSRAARETWHLENHGKTIIKPEQAEIITGIKKSLSKHAWASKLISDGHAEESLFWADPITNVLCKARPDFLHDKKIIVDIKSTSDCSPESFRRDMASFMYHVQAALYLDGASAVFEHEFEEFVIIACEKNPPFAVNCFHLGQETIDEGRALYFKALKILKQCQESGKYPAYDDSKIQLLGLPTWGFRSENI